MICVKKWVLIFIVAVCIAPALFAAAPGSSDAGGEPAADPSALVEESAEGLDTQMGAEPEAGRASEIDLELNEIAILPEESINPEEEDIAEEGTELSAEPEIAEMPEMIIIGSGPAWIAVDGGRRFGELVELIGMTDGIIYISSKDVLPLSDYTLEMLRDVLFEPDRDVFPSEDEAVIISSRDPGGNTIAGAIFVWVGVPAATAANSPLNSFKLSGDEPLEMEIAVTQVLNDGALPTFELSCAPALGEGDRFAVIVGIGDPAAIEGGSYTPDEPCELRFAVLDMSGQILAKSKKHIAELMDQAGGEEAASERAAPQGAPPATAAEIEITVISTDYFPGAVSDIAPLFTLSGLPTGGDYYYAVMVNGGDLVPLAGDTYAAEMEGSYTLRFAIAGAGDKVFAISGKFTVTLDFTVVTGQKQAYVADANSGSRRYGTLAGLLAHALPGSTIHIMTGETIEIGGGATALAGVCLLPDPDLYGEGRYIVRVSFTHPVTGAKTGLYITVTDVSGSVENPDTVDLLVEAKKYKPGKWSNAYPSFSLKKTPETAGGYSFAVIVDGGSPVLLNKGSYKPDAEGAYRLTFALMDGFGRIAAQSANYYVALDVTAPLIRAESGERGITVTATDALSDTVYISVDAGKTWQESAKQPDGSFVYAFVNSTRKAIPAGTIMAKDAAGNIAAYGEEIAAGIGGMGGYGGYGGMGGDGRTVSHASSDTSSTVAYEAVELTWEAVEMTVLTLGGEELDLAISRVTPDGSYIGAASFTAELGAWQILDDEGYDALILTAVTGEGEADTGDCAYQWDFSGAAYKKLAASGIDYLILRVGDQLMAISTAGFTAGVRYNLLKSGGVASGEFHYIALMGLTLEDMALSVYVDGGFYALTGDPAGEMYCYDVYFGSGDIMKKPSGV
jgi:hypothetical protein